MQIWELMEDGMKYEGVYAIGHMQENNKEL